MNVVLIWSPQKEEFARILSLHLILRIFWHPLVDLEYAQLMAACVFLASLTYLALSSLHRYKPHRLVLELGPYQHTSR